MDIFCTKQSSESRYLQLRQGKKEERISQRRRGRSEEEEEDKRADLWLVLDLLQELVTYVHAGRQDHKMKKSKMVTPALGWIYLRENSC